MEELQGLDLFSGVGTHFSSGQVLRRPRPTLVWIWHSWSIRDWKVMLQKGISSDRIFKKVAFWCVKVIYSDYHFHLSGVQISPTEVCGGSVKKNKLLHGCFWSCHFSNKLKWILALQILRWVINYLDSWIQVGWCNTAFEEVVFTAEVL